jgi:hypothetical protein
VTTALSKIMKLEPPRSWPREEKDRFEQLPFALQKYVAAHEIQREKTVRRSQNETATARQALAEMKSTSGKSDEAPSIEAAHADTH